MKAAARLTSTSVSQTIEIGRRLGELLQANDIIGLTGGLGAGKTHFAKGLAAGLEVSDSQVVNSPTFVIINEYIGRLHIYHVDVYRLETCAELQALGFEEMCSADGVVLIEWADKIQDLLPPDVLSIELAATAANSRDLVLTDGGPRSKHLLSELVRQYDEAT